MLYIGNIQSLDLSIGQRLCSYTCYIEPRVSCKPSLCKDSGKVVYIVLVSDYLGGTILNC